MNEHEQRKDMSLLRKYFKVESLLHRYRYFGRKQGRMADPYRGQGRVLALLRMQPEISQKDLGYLLGMRNQSLGELLAKLERAGYVTRMPSERDRRVMDVRLTPEGEAAAERMAEEQREADAPFDFLSEEDQANLSAILDRVIEALEAKMGDAETDERWAHRGYGPDMPPDGRQWYPPCGPEGWHGGPRHGGRGHGHGRPDRPDFGWDRRPDRDDPDFE